MREALPEVKDADLVARAYSLACGRAQLQALRSSGRSDSWALAERKRAETTIEKALGPGVTFEYGSFHTTNEKTLTINGREVPCVAALAPARLPTKEEKAAVTDQALFYRLRLKDVGMLD
jgi:hypothetical protein